MGVDRCFGVGLGFGVGVCVGDAVIDGSGEAEADGEGDADWNGEEAAADAGVMSAEGDRDGDVSENAGIGELGTLVAEAGEISSDGSGVSLPVDGVWSAVGDVGGVDSPLESDRQRARLKANKRGFINAAQPGQAPRSAQAN